MLEGRGISRDGIGYLHSETADEGDN